MIKCARITCAVMILNCLLPGIGLSQILFGRKNEVTFSVNHLQWTLSAAGQKKTVSQTLIPVCLFIPLYENAELRIITAGNQSRSEYNNGIQLNTMADTKLQYRYAFSQDRIMFSMGCNLPTGKTEMSSEELILSGWFANEIMGFPYRRFGEGFDINVGGVAVLPAGNIIFGGGYSYLIKGEYAPSGNSGRYRPGDETTTTGILDFKWNSNLIRSSVIYKTFYKDMLQGKDFFQKGTQLIWMENINLSFSRTSIIATIVGVIRGKNAILTNAGFAEEPYESSGSDFRLHLDLTQRLSEKTAASLLFEQKQLGANQYPENNMIFVDASDAMGIGVGISSRLGNRTVWQNRMYIRTGSTRIGGMLFDLSGIEFYTGLKISF